MSNLPEQWSTAGKVRITPKGIHNPSNTYEILDAVSNSDKTVFYMAKQNVPANTALTNTNYWVTLIDVKIGNLTPVSSINSTDKITIERSGAPYSVDMSTLNSSTLSALTTYPTEITGGTGCTFYYNDAVAVIRINVSITSPTQNDTTHIRLPNNVTFRYSTHMNMSALSSSYYPTDISAVVSAESNSNVMSIRYQSVPESTTVLCSTHTFPRGWFSIS